MPGIAIKPARPTAARARRPLAAPAAGNRTTTDTAGLRVSLQARVVWGAVAAFLGGSVAWLLSDHRIPDWDSGIHELLAVTVHNELAAGRLSAPFTDYNTYPPLVHLLGGLAVFLTGAHPMALILSSNVVFVPLLAFGCYGAAKIAFNRTAGMLAALLALGSPMVVSTMHQYQLDAPQAALVATAVWALFASSRLEDTRAAALAGAAAGLALLTKETSAVFLAGPVVVTALRGRANRRGVLAFAAACCLIAGPWYAYHAGELRSTLVTIGGWSADPLRAPPRFSLDSLTWYGWNLVNNQVLLPFTLAFITGAVLAARRLIARRTPRTSFEPELLAGAFVSYAGMTMLIHKDPRYTLPMLVFVAVLATGWIAAITRRRLRIALGASVALLSAAYLIGMATPLGGTLSVAIPAARHTFDENELTVYETAGWIRGTPASDGNIPGLLGGLHRIGIRTLMLYTGPDPVDFDREGLTMAAQANGMSVGQWAGLRRDQVATLILSPPGPNRPPACRRLDDGSRVYVALGVTDEIAHGVSGAIDPATLRVPGLPRLRNTLICPGRAPLVYP
jgi:4-amino-4-deoxy-L-arabinose transferase-like glycosyltransferase